MARNHPDRGRLAIPTMTEREVENWERSLPSMAHGAIVGLTPMCIVCGHRKGTHDGRRCRGARCDCGGFVG